MGRRENSYVGAWRYNGWEEFDCSVHRLNGDPCDERFTSAGRFQNRASVWAIVVGNDRTHGSFPDFVSVVEQGRVEEASPNLIESFIFFQGFYRTSLTVDGKTLSFEF